MLRRLVTGAIPIPLPPKRHARHEARAATQARPSRLTRGDLPVLTGLRIIPAVWVVLDHFESTILSAFPFTRFAEPVMTLGSSGFPIFFLLSGFVIWHNYGDGRVLTPRGICSFLWRRGARLWPVNLVTQLATIPILWVSVHRFNYWGYPIPDWYSVTGWLKNAFMVGQIGNRNAVYQWNQPAWSLTAEMVAYVLFPVAVVLILRVMWRIQSTVFWLALGLALAVLSGPSLLASHDWAVKLVLLFFSGVLLRRSGEPPSWLRPVLPALHVVVPALVLYTCYVVNTQYVSLLMAVWIYSLCHADSLVARALSRPRMLVAGQVSYSLYMVHFIVFATAGMLTVEYPVITARYEALYAIVCLVLAAMGGYLLWRFFETPSRVSMVRVFDRVWPKPYMAQQRELTRVG